MKVVLLAGLRGASKGQRTFSLRADLILLERAIERIGNVRLVIIDPVSSYLGKTDSHKNADVRGTLEPLGDMASRLRVAVVSITHFSKGAGQSAVNSFIGSIAFVAAARAAFIVTPDPDNISRRLFVQAKNNLAGDCGGLAYRIEQHLVGPNKDIVASAVAWEGERISWTADQVLSANRERVLAYTGLRRGDVVRIGRQHVRNGIATLKTETGSFTITVTLPVLPTRGKLTGCGSRRAPCTGLRTKSQLLFPHLTIR